jgi:hypothetical protein
MPTPAPSPLTDEALADGLRPLTDALEATGFTQDPSQPQPTWARTRLSDPSPADAAPDVDAEAPQWQEKVVLWRHPRLPWELHGYVASTRSPHAVHLRFFDPGWQPTQVLPGHWEKGFAFAHLDGLRALAAWLTEAIWPRALAWFEAPCPAEDLLSVGARVMSLVQPGPLLEQHRARAAWLAAQGRDGEAAFVRGVVAHIESLFR